MQIAYYVIVERLPLVQFAQAALTEPTFLDSSLGCLRSPMVEVRAVTTVVRRRSEIRASIRVHVKKS